MNARIKRVYRGFNNYHVLFLLCILWFSFGTLTTCRTTQPVIIDTGDIQRLEEQLKYYRGEFDRLSSENRILTERSLAMAERNLEMGERVNQTSRELLSLGASTVDEVSRLRSYLDILERFYNDINSRQSGVTHGELRTD